MKNEGQRLVLKWVFMV